MTKDLTLKEQIYRAASYEKWTNGAEFERLALQHGYKASNAGRRCRDLVKTGAFQRTIMQGTVWYRRTPAITLPPAFPQKPNVGTQIQTSLF